MIDRIIYGYGIALLALLLPACGGDRDIPDLRETYSSRDFKPFGGYVARAILEQSFPNNKVRVLKQEFGKNGSVLEDSASVYFCVSRYLFINEKDVESLLDFVYAGNTAFLASSSIDSTLLNRLYCNVADVGLGPVYIPGSYRQTGLTLVNAISPSKDSFKYYYQPFVNSFTEINDRYGRVVGYNGEGKANCIVFFWGKGKLFLHTESRAFSNYFLLTRDNYRYMQELMQVTHPSPQHVYWDEYYSKLNRPRKGGSNSSTLSELFKHPPLKAAFWILLLLLALYILFSAKRRQRIIREIKPNQNSSVAFTETIARLYLLKHDNKSIADKMITYFNEFIRSNYYLNTSMLPHELIPALSRKSGVTEEKTAAVFQAIDQANKADEIDDHQLLSLSGQIQQFYKKKK